MSKLIRDLLKNAMNAPDKIAIKCGHQERTYSEFCNNISRLATGFRNKGICSGDCMGVFLPNCVEFVETLFAAASIGVAIAPLSPSLPAPAILKAMESVNARHFIGTPYSLMELEKGIDANGALRLAIGNQPGEGYTLWDNFLDNITSCNPIKDDNSFNNNALIYTMTSGSTGTPKPIVLSQENKYLRAKVAADIYDITSTDIILAATPLYHSLAERLVILPLILGATSIILPRFSPEVWYNSIIDEKITFTIAVSSQLKKFAEIAEKSEIKEIKSLKCIVSSSALLDTQTRTKLLEILQCNFHECYGTSEIAIATNNKFDKIKGKINSVGQAIPGVNVRIVDENDQDVKEGQPGEIICQTPMLFSGYYQLPELTKNAIRGGWFHTGDIGYMDDEGFLYFLSRKKDIIITGGINVYPADVESVILLYSDIAACAAFSLPDEQLGEVVAVAVVSRSGTPINMRSLKFYCASNLADFQIPHHFFELKELPINSMGKIVKHKLTEMFSK